MNPDHISILRLKNQHVSGSGFRSAKEVAKRMGALQAQDYKMSKWAFGIRIQDSTETIINQSIDSGEIIRGHLLRPTWHFVSSDDYHWILELTAPQIRSAVKFRDKQLGLTGAVLRKSNAVIEKSLQKDGHLTREELISELKKAKIDVGENRASHLFLHAETDGIICSGKQKGLRPTFALLSEWVPENRKLIRDEALKELAHRYFLSHGPATLQDFAWWSGLTSKDSRKALEFNKSEFKSETIENQTYWFGNSVIDVGPDHNELYLLPAYDEFIISYHDRRASLNLPDHSKAVSGNGVFNPTIVLNGKVIGIWKRTIKKESMVLAADLFNPADRKIDSLISRASGRYENFTGKKAEVIP